MNHTTFSYTNVAPLRNGETVLVSGVIGVDWRRDRTMLLESAVDATVNQWALHLNRASDCMCSEARQSLTDWILRIDLPGAYLTDVVISRLQPEHQLPQPKRRALPRSKGQRATHLATERVTTFNALIHVEKRLRNEYPEVFSHPRYGNNVSNLLETLYNMLAGEVPRLKDNNDE